MTTLLLLAVNNKKLVSRMPNGHNGNQHSTHEVTTLHYYSRTKRETSSRNSKRLAQYFCGGVGRRRLPNLISPATAATARIEALLQLSVGYLVPPSAGWQLHRSALWIFRRQCCRCWWERGKLLLRPLILLRQRQSPPPPVEKGRNVGFCECVSAPT